MSTLTEKKIKVALKKLDTEMDTLYCRAFPSVKPSDAFWSEVERIDRRLGTALQVRPLAEMEIGMAQRAAMAAFTAAVSKERRDQQARAATA